MDLFNPQKKIQQQVNRPHTVSSDRVNSQKNKDANMKPDTPNVPKGTQSNEAQGGLRAKLQAQLSGSKPPHAEGPQSDLQGSKPQTAPNAPVPPLETPNTTTPNTGSQPMPKWRAPQIPKPALPRFKKL